MNTETILERTGLDLTVIAAVAQNGVIGKNGTMPWDYPTDLRHFHEETLGSSLIVGRNTFEGIIAQMGDPLKGRISIVLSNTVDERPEKRVVVSRSVSHAVRQAAAIDIENPCYVIGGESVYEQLLPYATSMVLTEIPKEPDGDAYFPEWDHSTWENKTTRESGELTFRYYTRNE